MTRTSLLIALSFLSALPSPALAQRDGYFGSRTNRPIHMDIAPVPKTTPEQMKCMRRVLLTVSGQAYETSRIRSLVYVRTDGTGVGETDPDHPANNCDVVDIGEVESFNTGFRDWKDLNIEVNRGTASNPGMFVTTFSSAKAVIENPDALMNSEKLHDGTRVFRHKETKIYVLPKEILKTGTGDPVVVFCKPDRDGMDPATPLREVKSNKCNARYFHPDGHGFGYAYMERRGDDTDHFGLDVLARKRLRDMRFPQYKQGSPPAPAAAAAPEPQSPAVQPQGTPPAQE